VRYGRYSVEDFLEENPRDQVTLFAIEMVAQLSQREWSALPGEQPFELKQRIEQSFESVSGKLCSEVQEEIEKRQEAQSWVDQKVASIEKKWNEQAVLASNEVDLLGSGQACAHEKTALLRLVETQSHPELNAHIQDISDKQSARQDFINDHLAKPALEQKLEEQGLDKVQEPERTPPQEPGKGSQLLDDTMEKAAEARKAREAEAALEAFNQGLEKIRSQERER